MTKTRPSREEILESYRACEKKLGKPPGLSLFCKTSGISQADVFYYWPTIGHLTREVGSTPNQFITAMPEDELFSEYARVCLHLKKVPSRNELRIATRELNTRTHIVYGRFKTISEFDQRFQQWLSGKPDDLKIILSFPGWRNKSLIKNNAVKPVFLAIHPFLPSGLQYLDMLSRGEMPQNESSDLSLNVLFERKCGDAFQALGFDVKHLGQGKGRVPDHTALARQYKYAIIIDAKVRKQGYVLGTDDRTFQEYVLRSTLDLKKDGIEKIYLAIVGSQFRESDIKKLSEYLAGSEIRGITFFTAQALMRVVQESIRDRSTFTLADFEKLLFGNRIVAA